MTTTQLETAQQRLSLSSQALRAVLDAAAEDLRLTHDRDIDPLYKEATERLEAKMHIDELRLKRLQILGR